MINKLNNELISVIVPCFNGGFLLEKCINSVINQTWNNKEIVLVNDGSDEKTTIQIINKFRSLPNINIIDQSNKGLPSARNTGIRNARGNYLFFLDSDDWIEPETLEQMYVFLKINKDASYIFADIVLEGEVNKIVKKEYNLFEQLFLNQLPYSIFIKKEICIKYGGYDEEMRYGYEDWEFNIRLGSHKINGKRLPYPLFHYSVNQYGMLLSKSSKRHSKIWKYIISKNKNLFRFRNLISLWKKWRSKKSTYPLFIFFAWYLCFKFLPHSLVSKIFIILRNFKWFFSRRNFLNWEKKF